MKFKNTHLPFDNYKTVKKIKVEVAFDHRSVCTCPFC